MLVQAIVNQRVIPTHKLYDWDPETKTLHEVDDRFDIVRLGYCCVGVPAWAVKPVDLSGLDSLAWL